MKVLLLYTELAGYTMACLDAVRALGGKVLTIHYPINPEAPFRFDDVDRDAFLSIDRFSSYSDLMKTVDDFDPDIIVCAGWVNKWYLKVCRRRMARSVNILAIDNHWEGTLKQHALSFLSNIFIRNAFRKVWVPGKPQIAYARKLGFHEDNIMTGFYSCDVNRFSEYYIQSKEPKKTSFPRRFICAARYIPEKNYDFLWKSFLQWKRQTGSDWELWCAGTGELFDARLEHPSIRHLGFIQPGDWPELMRSTGVFVLASKYEPWGVAVHEFAAAGFPLLLSDKVGAASHFVDQSNGVIFSSEKEDQLISGFEAMASKTMEELITMGENSNRLAHSITPARWAGELYAALNMRE